MAETLAEISVCDSCGVDVRDESLYCYNCGERVRAEDKAVEKNDHQPETEVAVAKAPERPPLRSAASLRKQRRAYNRQPVEVSWEQPNGSPVGFIITTVVLAVGALVLLVLALYLR